MSAVHASTAAFAAPYPPAPRLAAIEPSVTMRASGAKRGVSAAVTSTADIKLASRLARHAAAMPARSPSPGGSRSKSVFPPALFTSTSTRSGSWPSAAETAAGSAASKHA